MVQVDHLPSHLDLLCIATRVRAAAVAGDDDALHSELCGLRNALTEHLRAERLDAPTNESVGRIVLEGQQRLLRLVDGLLFGPRDGVDDCNCLVRATEVDIALRRQARLESLAFGAEKRDLSRTPDVIHRLGQTR